MTKINKAIQGEDIQGKGRNLARACLLVRRERESQKKRGGEETMMVQYDEMQERRKPRRVESSKLCIMLYID